MNTPLIARAGALAALWLAACAAHAIEVPKPPPPPEQKQEAPPPELTVTPTDERAFYEKIQRVTAYRSLRGLKIPAEVIAELGRGNADGAVATLSRAASEGNKEADIALVHVQHWCNAVSSQRVPGDPKAAIAKVVQGQPDQRAARVAGVMFAELDYVQRARASCSKARFDYTGIEARLRASADAGDPASATELAQFLRDPAKREAMLHHIQKLLHERTRFAPIFDYFWPSGLGPRVEEASLMKIDPFPWSAPIEDVRLKQP